MLAVSGEGMQGDKWGKHSVLLPDPVTRQRAKTNGQGLPTPEDGASSTPRAGPGRGVRRSCSSRTAGVADRTVCHLMFSLLVVLI